MWTHSSLLWDESAKWVLVVNKWRRENEQGKEHHGTFYCDLSYLSMMSVSCKEHSSRLLEHDDRTNDI